MVQEYKQISFTPEVLAKIVPDVSLRRHLNLGLRPCLRGFSEFKPLDVTTGSLQEIEDQRDGFIAGSAVGKNGDTMAVCTITLGVIEESKKSQILSSESSLPSYSSVYPVVEIARGRSGAPTDEEMILSQKLYETVLHSKIIPSDILRSTAGLAIVNDSGQSEIIYPDIMGDNPLFEEQRTFSFVLYAHIKVFSRTSPLFDFCYYTLMNALRNTVLPPLFVEDSFTSVKIPVRSRGNFGHLRKQNKVVIDRNPALMKSLKIRESEIGLASSFGIVDLEKTEVSSPDINKKQVILADLEGEAEEHECLSRITILPNKDHSHLKHVSILGGGSHITIDTIDQCVEMARIRSENVY